MPLWLLQAFWQQAFPRSCHRKCGIACLVMQWQVENNSICHAMPKEAKPSNATLANKGIMATSFTNILTQKLWHCLP
jgi:hypothetical protein